MSKLLNANQLNRCLAEIEAALADDELSVYALETHLDAIASALEADGNTKSGDGRELSAKLEQLSRRKKNESLEVAAGYAELLEDIVSSREYESNLSDDEEDAREYLESLIFSLQRSVG